MAVPDYQSLMLPILQALADGNPRPVSEVRADVAQRLGLSEDELQERIPSGQPVFDSRANWAMSYMAQAGVLHRPRRGIIRITERGREALGSDIDRIDNRFLEQFEEFREFRERSRRPRHTSDQAGGETQSEPADEQTEIAPQERLSAAVNEANAALATEIVERLRSRDPSYLEGVVLRLLTALGYGGAQGGTEQLGGPGDRGLDGLIRQDSLGLDRIYVQAKRYAADSPVGRAEVQQFIGALRGAQTDRGVFITTSRFTPQAKEEAPRNVVLIDGDELGRLMVEHNVGAETAETFELKRMDENFFEDE